MTNEANYLECFVSTQARKDDYFADYAIAHRADWERLRKEYPYILRATLRAYERGGYDKLIELRDALRPHLDAHGLLADSLMLDDRAIAAAQSQGQPMNVARFTHDKADVLNQRGEYVAAEQLYRESEKRYLAINHPALALRSRHMRALVIRAQGRLVEAKELCQTTVTDAQREGLERWLAHPYYVLALLARDTGDYQQAERWVLESVARLEGTDELSMLAQCYYFLGGLGLAAGRLSDARAWLEASLKLSQDHDIPRQLARTRRVLGEVLRSEHRLEEADSQFREAHGLAANLNEPPLIARVLLSRAYLALQVRDWTQATTYAEEAKSIYRGAADDRGRLQASLLLVYAHSVQFRLIQAIEEARHLFSVIWLMRKAGMKTLLHLMSKGGNW